MIYLSQRPNLDPEPWVSTYGRDVGQRYATQRPAHGFRRRFDPRPEFDHTRDPFPGVYADGVRSVYPGPRRNEQSRWAPRREQFDVPVNPILAAFRTDRHYSIADRARDYLLYLAQHPAAVSKRYSLDEIDHARRVLARLATLDTATQPKGA